MVNPELAIFIIAGLIYLAMIIIFTIADTILYGIFYSILCIKTTPWNNCKRPFIIEAFLPFMLYFYRGFSKRLLERPFTCRKYETIKDGCWSWTPYFTFRIEKKNLYRVKGAIIRRFPDAELCLIEDPGCSLVKGFVVSSQFIDKDHYDRKKIMDNAMLQELGPSKFIIIGWLVCMAPDEVGN